MFLDDSDPSHANYATVNLDGKQQEADSFVRIKRA